MMKLMFALLPTCLAWADWCKWVPWGSQVYVPECNGYNYAGRSAYGCASWCMWVPGGSWGYVPECSACYTVYSRNYKSAAPIIPQTEQSGCKASCQWLSRVSWNSTSDCEQCEQPMVLTKQTETARSPKLKVKTGQPDWCKWVPVGSWQYVGECNTAPTQTQADTNQYGGCAGWCGWSPVSAWQYIAECQQCSPDVQATGAAVVPTANCDSWCQWVSRPSWQYVGACTGCEALVQAQYANTNNKEIHP
eukprot:Skav228162  [mRNA]  locus=scaffold439:196253:196996:+ [translate_table: standard]